MHVREIDVVYDPALLYRLFVKSLQLLEESRIMHIREVLLRLDQASKGMLECLLGTGGTLEALSMALSRVDSFRDAKARALHIRNVSGMPPLQGNDGEVGRASGSGDATAAGSTLRVEKGLLPLESGDAMATGKASGVETGGDATGPLGLGDAAAAAAAAAAAGSASRVENGSQRSGSLGLDDTTAVAGDSVPLVEKGDDATTAPAAEKGALLVENESLDSRSLGLGDATAAEGGGGGVSRAERDIATVAAACGPDEKLAEIANIRNRTAMQILGLPEDEVERMFERGRDGTNESVRFVQDVCCCLGEVRGLIRAR